MITHPEKIYWPKEKYTKGDLASYYEKIAPYIIPYLKKRPIVMHRFPNGINEPGFYHKDIGVDVPKFIKTIAVDHEERKINYLTISNVKSLLYAVNLGSIEIHPFLSRFPKLDFPDFCVIDLDPHDVPFEELIETALVLHELLEAIEIPHFCKTSGGKGLHICIPLHAKYDFDQSKNFAELLASYVHGKLPEFTSIERKPAKRPKKVYIDFLQNRFGQTIAAPYSVRPRPKASVSTPLLWSEVNKKLRLDHFTIKTVPARVAKMGDIFNPVLGPGINMNAALKKLKLR